ncbi:hypothetical protein OQA88_768 [Cercophora sp. LCS_1]
MEFSLTFGAVGDFIAVCSLVKEIIVALDDARGSAREFCDLQQHLEILGSVLQEADHTFANVTLGSALRGLGPIVPQTTAGIRRLMENLRVRMERFAPSLSTEGSGSWARDAKRKIQWRFEKGELETFRKEIVAYSGALQLLLQLASIHLVNESRHGATPHQTNNSIVGRVRGLLRVQTQDLQSILGRMVQTLVTRLRFISDLGTDLKAIATRTLSVMLETHSEIQSVRGLILGLERPLREEYFMLEDPLGREFPIHLRLITSFELLNCVLEQRFKGRSGSGRIAKSRYVLHDRVTGRRISQANRWEDAFLPGRRIDMSILCWEPERERPTRVTEIANNLPVQSLKRSRDESPCACCGEAPSKKLKTLDHVKETDGYASDTSDEGDFSDFKRVAFISKESWRASLKAKEFRCRWLANDNAICGLLFESDETLQAHWRVHIRESLEAPASDLALRRFLQPMTPAALNNFYRVIGSRKPRKMKSTTAGRLGANHAGMGIAGRNLNQLLMRRAGTGVPIKHEG